MPELTSPIQAPQRFTFCVPAGVNESAPIDCAAELVPLLEYGEMLFQACQALDALWPVTERCLREGRTFFFRARALSELATMASFFGPSEDEALRQFAIRARDFYSRALGDGDANNPLRRTHPNHYERLHGAGSHAKELLLQGDRPLRNTTLARALRDLQRIRPLLARDFLDSYLLVNMQTLMERVELTHLAPELGQAAYESLQRMSLGQPRDESALDMVQHVMGLVSNTIGDGPAGSNSAAIHVMHIALHYWRPENGRSLWNVMVQQMVQASPRNARESMRAALQAGRYEETKEHLRANFQHGPATTLAPWIADWLSLIQAVDGLLDAEYATPAEQLEAGLTAAEALTNFVADASVMITRGAAWYRGTRIPPPQRTRVGPRHLVRRLRRAALFEGRARQAAQVVPRPSWYMRAAVRTEAAFGTQLFRGNAGYTTVGGSLGLAFSAVNLVFSARDVWNTWEEGDTWGARYAEMRLLGSALIVLGMCLSGPLAPIVGLTGIVLQVAGEPDEANRPRVASTLRRLVADVRACLSNDDAPVSGEGQRGSAQPSRTLRIASLLRLDRELVELEHIARTLDSACLHYGTEAERQAIVRQLASIGLELDDGSGTARERARRLPPEILRIDQARSLLLL